MLNRLLLRAGQIGVLGTMALLVLVEMTSGGLRASPLIVLQVAVPIAVAVVWLPLRPPGALVLPVGAIAVSLVSLLITAALVHEQTRSSLWGLAETVGMLGMLGVATRNAPARWAAAAVPISLVAVSLMPLRSGSDPVLITFCLVQALGGAAAISVGFTLRNMETNRRLALESVRADQRAEFARDLHDFIAHHVTGIVVQAQGARFIAEQNPRVLLALEQIEKAGAETMASMRRMVGVLRDPHSRPDAPLAPIAGVPDLPALVEQFTAVGGPVARLHLDDDAHELPVEVSTSAYRVVMEALTNVRRHAPGASAVDVWLRRTPKALLLQVANDGPPRPPAPRDRSGYGLAGLTERIRAVGGQMSAGPGVDGGWVVDAALPLS